MQVYLGIDWSEKKHDVIFMNEVGASIGQLVISHTPEGFQKLDRTREKFDLQPGQCLVGLETAHNLLIDFLWDRDYHHVYVVPPSVVKGSLSLSKVVSATPLGVINLSNCFGGIHFSNDL